MTDSTTCRDCGALIAQGDEKALSGEVQTVWGDLAGEWVCPATGDEHEPGTPLRPVKVTVRFGDSETMVRLSLAEFGNFVVRPIQESLDDGEAAWDLQDRNPERRASIDLWAKNLYRITAP